MTATILFPNANDVSVNKTICTKMGVAEEYKSAMRLFNERRVVNHNYLIIRQDITLPDQPRVYTNLFGEIPNLGRFPVLFPSSNSRQQ